MFRIRLVQEGSLARNLAGMDLAEKREVQP